MLLAHISDLHLGKKLHEFSLLEDQEYILMKVLEIVKEKKVDGILIAGDVYDKSVPPADSIQLFDEFLTLLAQLDVPVFVVSGNHDSPERLSYGARLLKSKKIFFSPVFQGDLEPVTLKDEYGPLHVHLLPFVKPATVRKVYPEEEIGSYNQAVKVAVKNMKVDAFERNILIAHQFVTGALRCESEDVSVGGVDNVDAGVFSDFDYVALGHLHSPQHVGRPQVRYCGTPLKYSVSESNHSKSLTLVEFGPKGVVDIETIPLIPKRDLRKIKGTYMELTARENYEGTDTEDYIYVTLTDEQDVVDALAKLRAIYPNVIGLEYDNMRTRKNQQIGAAEEVENKSPLDLFDDLYALQNNVKMDKIQREYVQTLMEEIWEDRI